MSPFGLMKVRDITGNVARRGSKGTVVNGAQQTTAKGRPEAWLDIGATGFWTPGQRTFWA